MTRKKFSEKVKVLLEKNLSLRHIAEKLNVPWGVVAYISVRGDGPANFNCYIPSCKKELTMDTDLRTRFCKKHSYITKLSGRDRNREVVRIRDKHTCQACGKVWTPGKRRFDCHHLDGLCGKMTRDYDKTKDLGRLITMCHKCHLNQPHVTSKMKKKNRSSIKKIDKAVISDMNKDRDNGMSYGKIAKKYGLSYPTARKILIAV